MFCTFVSSPVVCTSLCMRIGLTPYNKLQLFHMLRMYMWTPRWCTFLFRFVVLGVHSSVCISDLDKVNIKASKTLLLLLMHDWFCCCCLLRRPRTMIFSVVLLYEHSIMHSVTCKLSECREGNTVMMFNSHDALLKLAETSRLAWKTTISEHPDYLIYGPFFPSTKWNRLLPYWSDLVKVKKGPNTR